MWEFTKRTGGDVKKCCGRDIETKRRLVAGEGTQSAGLAGVSSGMGLDDGLLVCTLLLLI